MSGAHCERFPTCMEVGMNATTPTCSKSDCPGNKTWAGFFAHVTPRADACEHKWDGPGEAIDGGHGWTSTCSKCGMTAFDHSMRYGE